MLTITTNSEKETYNFAKKFAKTLKGGEVIGLVGDLGAGKTVFTKGLAVGLGIKKTISSPTYVIMKVYKSEIKKINYFVHIDAYRLKSKNDLLAIGAEEYINHPETVTVIEWADNVNQKILNNYLLIKITNQGDKDRIIYLNS